MNKILQPKFLFGLVLIVALFSFVPTSVFAASNSAYLTAPSGSIQTGKTFTVSVDGTVTNHWWGSGPNSADGVITFPAANLKVLSVDDKTGAAFPYSETAIDNTTGKITIKQRTATWTYLQPNITVHLLTITFQALNPGTANVEFSSMGYSTGTASKTGGVYTVTSPPPPPSPSPTPTPTPKPTVKPKPTVAPKPTPTPTPTPPPTIEETPPPTSDSDGGLKIQNIKITTNRNDSRISWTISQSGTSPTLVYGLSKGAQTLKSEVKKLEDGSFEVALKDLKPGTLYHFTIKAATDNNLQGGNHAGTFTTRGYPVQLTIQQNNLLLPGAKVRIDERSFVANKDGIITTELSDGEHTAQITPAGSDEAYPVKFTVTKKTIPASGSPDLQSLMLNVSTIGSTSGVDSSLIWPIIGAVLAGIAIVGGIIGFVIFNKKRSGDTESATIDTDMLAASYGQPVESLYQNTPAPNLETQGIAPVGIFQEQPLQPVPQSPIDPNLSVQTYDTIQQPLGDPGTVIQDPNSNLLPEQQVQMSADPSFDPGSLPLPPTDPSSPIAVEPSMPMPYTEEEQLASELVQVESTQPDAIYDEVTGELDILHGSERTNLTHSETPTDTDDSIETEDELEQPMNDLDIQHNKPDEPEDLPQSSMGVVH